MRSNLARLFWLGMVALAVPACGGGGSGGGAGVSKGKISAIGGFAFGNGAGPLGGDGGRHFIFSQGNIRVGVNPPPGTPIVPEPPTNGTVVTSSDLTGATFTLPGQGNLILSGKV